MCLRAAHEGSEQAFTYTTTLIFVLDDNRQFGASGRLFDVFGDAADLIFSDGHEHRVMCSVATEQARDFALRGETRQRRSTQVACLDSRQRKAMQKCADPLAITGMNAAQTRMVNCPAGGNARLRRVWFGAFGQLCAHAGSVCRD